MNTKDRYTLRQPVWFWIPVGITGSIIFGLAVGAAIISSSLGGYTFGGTFHFLLFMGGPIIALCAAASSIWFWRNRSRSFAWNEYALRVPGVLALILLLFPIPFVLLLALFWDSVQYALKFCYPGSSTYGLWCSSVRYVASTMLTTSFVYPFTVILAFTAALPSMLVLPLLVLQRHTVRSDDAAAPVES